jgi:hypothetical protein
VVASIRESQALGRRHQKTEASRRQQEGTSNPAEKQRFSARIGQEGEESTANPVDVPVFTAYGLFYHVLPG